MSMPGPTHGKTPKGVEEVARRTHGLGPRVRQLLIMIDGKRDDASVLAMFPPEIGPGLMAQLVDGEFVHVLEQPEAPAPVPAAGTAAQPPGAAASSAQAAPAGTGQDDPFVLGRTFMINTASRMLGVAGDSIVGKLRVAPDLDGLRALYPAWIKAICESPDGAWLHKDLERKLSKVLGKLPSV